MQGHREFAGRIAVVTGGARGIGLAIVRALVDRGAQVHVFDLAQGEEAAGVPYRFHPVDVSDSGAVSAAVAALPSPAAFLVNNAGITRDRSAVHMSDEEWQAVLSVNLTGAFHMVRALAPAMRKAGYGRIVNIASINGLRGKFGQANYCASKAGLIGLTKTLARELGPKGITVNAVAPGMVMTEMTRSLPEEVIARAKAESVLPDLAVPEDVAGVVCFLLSDGARMVTGEVIRVDAGQYI